MLASVEQNTCMLLTGGPCQKIYISHTEYELQICKIFV